MIHSDLEFLKQLRGQGKINKRHAKYVNFLEQFSYVIRKMELYVNDVDFGKIFALYANLANGEYFRHEGFLSKEKRLCVLKGSIKELLVREAHEGGLMRHFGE
ncbi:hypothetical protein CR513_05685, partial [Mucuna pruriens]